jgi:uncharacterized protein YegP (UPF0339 family)
MKGPRIKVTKSARNGQWYWSYQAGNNKILADGGEGYHNLQDALESMAQVVGGEILDPDEISKRHAKFIKRGDEVIPVVIE